MQLARLSFPVALLVAPSVLIPPASAQAPMPAARGLVAAFTTHRVVAIAEAHLLREAGDFYVALVRDTAFQRIAPDIVIEFASRQSQPLLDRYVLRCDAIPIDTLRTIWRNTTKAGSWESPVYARRLTAIRDVNCARSAARRLRVLAADSPVDWASMRTPTDWAALGDNNLSFADVITNGVLAKGKRAFVVFGSNHLMRTGARDDGPNTTTRVLSKYPASMYVAWLYNARPGSDEASRRMSLEHWPKPALVPLAGSWVGTIPAGNHRFGEIADAVLYLGHPDSLHVEDADPALLDASYRRELDRRAWLEWGDSSHLRSSLHYQPAPLSGDVAEFQVESKVYGRQRHVWVYTPPGYPVSCAASCAALVAFDGGVYIDAIPLPRILDSLTASKAIPPTVALLIDNASSSERLADLANHQRFVAFIGNELMPWFREKWRVTRDPARTIITGSSAGGLASAYLAHERPDLFGNVLSQSGAFWRGNEGSDSAPFEWVTSQYAATPHLPIRFFLDVGAKESIGAMGETAPSILASNRRLRDVLQAKGYDVQYFEVPNGSHAPESWRLRLPVGLAALAVPR